MTSLVTEFNESFRTHNLLLTTTFAGPRDVIVKALNYKSMHDHLDYLHFMHIATYPVPTRFTENHVYSDRDPETLGNTINGLVAEGIPTRKIVLSVMFAASIYTTNVYTGPMVKY